MKREKLRTFMVAAVFATAIALGGLGCLVSGLSLAVEDPVRLKLTVAAVAVACAALFPRRHGTMIVLCAAALVSGYLWHRGTVWEQTKYLIDLISRIYDRAYNWGATELSRDSAGFVDGPLSLWGCVTAMGVCRAVCCRKTSAWGIIPGAGMLGLCLVVTDTVPETGPLFAFLAGNILLLLTGGVRKESAGQGSRLAAAAAAPVCLFLLAIFLASPRAGYVDRSAQLRERITGTLTRIPEQVMQTMEERTHPRPVSSQKVDLQALGPQESYKLPVMEVYSQYGGTIYLRGRDYDRYTGTGWESTPDRQEPFSGGGVPVETVRIRTLAGSFGNLYLPCFPDADITLTGGELENSEHLRVYEVGRCAFGAGAEEPDSRYLSLPEETAARAGRLLTENNLLDGDPRAIGRFVSRTAVYDRGTEAMPKNETDFALWFLESADTGYCVHFATGAVVLLRAAGIPARYVTGYLAEAKGEEWATVTSDRAHAWTEYYDKDAGRWEILDATPAAPEEDETEAPTAVSLPETQPTESTLPEETAQTIPTGEAGPEPEEPAQEQEKPDLSWLLTWVKGAGLALAALSALALQRMTRLYVRRKRTRQGSGSRRGLLMWQEAERAAKLLGENPPEELLASAQKARFSQHDLTEEELAPFEEYLRRCRVKLRRAPWYRRLVYRWVYALI